MACADPCAIGTRTEGIILAALLERGFEVAIPFGNRAKYDFVIDDGKRLQRVQCKTAHAGSSRDSIRFNTHGLSAVRNGRRRKCSYRGMIDSFAVQYPGNRSVYLVPVDDAPDCGECYLRLGPAANGQMKGVRWAREYQIR